MFSYIFEFLAKAISYIQLPQPKLHNRHSEQVKRAVQEGDVILCKSHGSLASLFIPGYWDHAALVISKCYVIEATTKGVRVTNIDDLVMSKDAVSVWAPNKPIHANPLLKAIPNYSGMPYDFRFRLNNKAIYCSELIVNLYRLCGPLVEFKKSKLFGRSYYEPDTFLNSGDFDCIYDSRKEVNNGPSYTC